MSQKRKNTDYLDDLFDKHFNDKDFMNTNLADFGQMVRETINEEARKQGYDTMSDLISGEIQEGLSGNSRTRKRPVTAAVHRRHGRYRTRYEYVREMLENIVYFELRRRGYEVYIGKNETKEIDFVAVQRDERIYVQVCRRLPEESDREVANLLEIKDHYPKYVVTLDELAAGNINGVKIVHLADFLLSGEY